MPAVLPYLLILLLFLNLSFHHHMIIRVVVQLSIVPCFVHHQLVVPGHESHCWYLGICITLSCAATMVACKCHSNNSSVTISVKSQSCNSGKHLANFMRRTGA